MNSMFQRSAIRFVAVLILGLAQTLVPARASNGASVPGTSPTSGKETSDDHNDNLLGNLILPRAQTAVVNDNLAVSGTTIFSGSRIRTSDDQGAIVQLGALGSVFIEPRTDLMMSFNSGRVDVRLLTGHASVISNAGSCSIISADGTIVNCEEGTNQSSQNPPKKKWSKKKKAAVIIPLVAGGVITTLLIVGDDDSPAR